MFQPKLWQAPGLWPFLGVVEPNFLSLLHKVTIGLLGLTLIGFGGRVISSLTFTLSFFMTSYSFHFNQFHSLAPLTFSCLILIFSKTNAAWSADRLLKRKTWSGPPPSFSYLWPLRLLQSYIAFAYFTSAITKLNISGWKWVWSDNIPMILLHGYVPTTLRSYLLSHSWFWIQLGATLVLLMELIAPAMLLTPMLRLIFALEILLFQSLVILTLGSHEAFLTYPLLMLLTIPLTDWKMWGRKT
ncbi:MAG: hypothetical protein KDD61_08195 [Bdellovibrionales bacterium]|nr:hypothetical protein [Bdellovibrionales bacterium]